MLRIAEIGICSEEDDTGTDAFPAKSAHHIYAVHNGHFDIRYNKIGFSVFYKRKPGKTVRSFSDDLAVNTLPVNGINDALTNEIFILYYDYLFHFIAPGSSF